MPEPSQTTVYGASEALRPATAPQTSAKAERLFTAPQTMRGQLAMSTDEPLCAKCCTPDECRRLGCSR